MSDRDALATRVVHAGLDPDPTYGSVIPAIHQTSTFRQPRVGEFVEDYDYARSANPTRAARSRPAWPPRTRCSRPSARPAITS